MTSDRTGLPATPTGTHADPDADRDADARFAAFLAEAAANVDDPELGEVYRMFVDDPPDMQRALFDIGEDAATRGGAFDVGAGERVAVTIMFAVGAAVFGVIAYVVADFVFCGHVVVP